MVHGGILNNKASDEKESPVARNRRVTSSFSLAGSVMVVASATGRYNFLSLQTRDVKVLSAHNDLYCRSSSAVVLRNTLLRKVQHLKYCIQRLFLEAVSTIPGTCRIRAGVAASVF